MGYIVHQQSDFLSHGISVSTCKETKQSGQWFLHVLSAWEIFFQQLVQIKDSFIFFMIVSCHSDDVDEVCGRNLNIFCVMRFRLQLCNDAGMTIEKFF